MPREHPFLNQHHDIDNIYYEDTRSMSIKLERVHMQDDELVNSFLNARLGLTNFWNFYYVGNLYMGANLDQARVVWDTGSEWLVL